MIHIRKRFLNADLTRRVQKLRAKVTNYTCASLKYLFRGYFNVFYSPKLACIHRSLPLWGLHCSRFGGRVKKTFTVFESQTVQAEDASCVRPVAELNRNQHLWGRHVQVLFWSRIISAASRASCYQDYVSSQLLQTMWVLPETCRCQRHQWCHMWRFSRSVS